MKIPFDRAVGEARESLNQRRRRKLERLDIIKQGPVIWNKWRTEHPREAPDLGGADLAVANLSGADLSGAVLRGADLSNANLTRAKLTRANLVDADLIGAELSEADLVETNLTRAYLAAAKLSRAKLIGANLSSANLVDANLSGADLTGAILEGALLIQTNMEDSNLTGCHIYGISAWDVSLRGAVQSNLVITERFKNEGRVQVDNLEIAQFIYLLLHHQRIRDVIDTIGKKAVLILGRFTDNRMAVLEAVRNRLRSCGYLPILFDFPQSGRTTLETVSILAHMARFVIADLTDARSVLQELQAIVPVNPSVPIQPLLLDGQGVPGMFDFFRSFPWVLAPFLYKDEQALLAELEKNVIGPAEAKAREQRAK